MIADPAAIPSLMREAPRWVCWRFEQRAGQLKPTKVPLMATGNRASSTDSSTWATFCQARLAAQRHGWGLGFMLGDGWTGIDLDAVRDPATGRLESWAEALVERLHTYAEVSPSGTGIHLFARGALPPGGRRKGKIESYDAGRFFTVTGLPVPGAAAAVANRTVELAAWHCEVFGEAPPRPAPPSAPCTASDSELLRRAVEARNGAAFVALWRGDWQGRYGSQSEADLALCSHLAYWCGGDAGRMDALFRRSGLMRAKWDERHGACTYGATTIGRAIQGAAAARKEATHVNAD